jgi:hypothetical protein
MGMLSGHGQANTCFSGLKRTVSSSQQHLQLPIPIWTAPIWTDLNGNIVSQSGRQHCVSPSESSGKPCCNRLRPASKVGSALLTGRPASSKRPINQKVYVLLPYWAFGFIVAFSVGFSKPVCGRFADPHAAGARLSTARYQFNLT